jgi:hypothetical protein
MGLHVQEWNITLGNLTRLVGRQVRRYRNEKG